MSLTGADAGNYTFSQPTGVTGNITPRSLAVTAVSDTKTYDGTTRSALAPTIAGLVSGDSVSGSATQSFADRNAGVGKTLSGTPSDDRRAVSTDGVVAAGSEISRCNRADVDDRCAETAASAALIRVNSTGIRLPPGIGS